MVAIESYETVNNVSSMNQVISVTQSGLIYTILTDRQISNNVDFSASTIAVSTQCKPITSACHFISVHPSGNANCSTGFSVDFNYSNEVNSVVTAILTWYIDYFNDPGMTQRIDAEHLTNPMYFGLSVFIEDLKLNASSFALYNDADILSFDNFGFGYIVECNVTIYDATYTWINGSFNRFSTLSPANITMAGILNSQQLDLYYTYQMASTAFQAGYTSDTAQTLADKLALTYSQGAIGYVAGAFSPRANEEEQLTEILVVTRLPLAPLYTLICLNFLYGVVSVIVAIIALFDNASSDSVRCVQGQLSVWGLIFQAFQIPVQEKHIQDGDCEEGQESVRSIVVGVEKDRTVEERSIFRSWDMR